MFRRWAARRMVLGVIVVLAAPDVRIGLARDSEQYRERIDAATNEALASYDRWLGPFPAASLTIPSAGLPWQSPEPLMEVEAAVAYNVALGYWPHLARGPGAVPVAESVAWYLQSLVVERLFNVRYGVLAYSTDGARLFGDFVPWPVPSLRLSRWTGGLSRDAFLNASRSSRRLPRGVDDRVIRGALAFGSLERYLGWPSLQAALRALAAKAADGSMAFQQVIDIVSAAAGQDLTWFFTAAFDPAVPFDYAIQAFTTTPETASCPAGPCYRTEVSVLRRGSGQFTGTSRAPVGGFEAGHALGLRVTFDNGEAVTTRWDGRAPRRTFEFESASPASFVQLDPQGALLLDLTPLDHVQSASSRTNVPIGKWAARWTVWLQDAMLAGSALF